MQIIPSIHALRHSFVIPAAPGLVLDRFVYSYIVQVRRLLSSTRGWLDARRRSSGASGPQVATRRRLNGSS